MLKVKAAISEQQQLISEKLDDNQNIIDSCHNILKSGMYVYSLALTFSLCDKCLSSYALENKPHSTTAKKIKCRHKLSLHTSLYAMRGVKTEAIFYFLEYIRIGGSNN